MPGGGVLTLLGLILILSDEEIEALEGGTCCTVKSCMATAP